MGEAGLDDGEVHDPRGEQRGRVALPDGAGRRSRRLRVHAGKSALQIETYAINFPTDGALIVRPDSHLAVPMFNLDCDLFNVID